METTVSLLFDPSARPDAAAIAGLARKNGGFSVSFEPAIDGNGLHWIELLANGLTFDLTGLAPGPSIHLASCEHSFGLPEGFDASALDAVSISPGPHLTSGGVMLPVIRCMAWLAAQLCGLPGLQAITWNAARTCNGPEYFRDSVMRWITGGVFPGLGLTALVPQADGAIRSDGLALFTGQELCLDAALAGDRSEGAKVALRLIHWLVDNGRIDRTMSLTGPSGETLLLRPDHDKGMVFVSGGAG